MVVRVMGSEPAAIEGEAAESNICPSPVISQRVLKMSGKAIRKRIRRLSVKTFGLPLSA